MVNRMLRTGLTALLCSAIGAFAIQIACGLEGIADYGTSLAFKDAMKMCRQWRVVDVSSNWDYTHAHLGRADDAAAISQIPLRSDGYPTQVPYNGRKVLTLVLCALPAACYPFGTFTLSFEGSGEVYLGWDAGGPAPANYTEGFLPAGHGITVTGGGGTTTRQFTVSSAAQFFGRFAGAGRSTGILLHINRSEAADPVRNIRIIVPDASGGTSYAANEATQPFNPKFLEDIRPFTLFRFMDWGATNGSAVTTWSQRLTQSTTYAATAALGNCGVAYEYMVDLCNLLRRDMWVCIPHQADANYHTQLARLIRDRLDPARKVYVEFSNETWNGSFAQTGYCSGRATSLGLGTGSYPSWTNSGVYSVYAAVRIWKIFQDEFGASAGTRLVKVLSGWHINTDFTGAQIWALGNATVNPNGISANAYATAPYIYYAGDLTSATPATTVFNYLNGTSLRDIGSNCRNQRTLISGAGLQFITYEGGQHLLGDETKQREINNDTRIYNVYRAYIDTLNANGVAMLNQFVAVSSWGVYGCWGAKEYVAQPLAQAHKYRALFDYMTTVNNQFDTDEPKYWELVAVRPPRAAVGNGALYRLGRDGVRLVSGAVEMRILDVAGRLAGTGGLGLPAAGTYVAQLRSAAGQSSALRFGVR